MKSMIAYIKLPLIHRYHIFSNSTDVNLPKNYHKQYSLIWYRPTMLAHGLNDISNEHIVKVDTCESRTSRQSVLHNFNAYVDCITMHSGINNASVMF